MLCLCCRKRNDAFSLVELIITVAVIATLSSIVIFSFNSVQSNTRDSQRSVKIFLIAESLEEYYDNNGEYPSCSVMSQSPSVVISTLKNLDPSSLATPTAPVGTNSIVACEGDPTTDVYHYIGGVSEYILKYKKESSGSIVSVNSRHSVPTPIPDIPTTPVVTTNTIGDNTIWAWVDVVDSCSDENTSSYRYKYTISPVGYDSGWVDNGTNLSVSFTTNNDGQTYTVAVQARCGNLFTSSSWSMSGSADYVRTSEVVGDIYDRISANSGGTCAVASDDNAYCWGDNGVGLIGDGTRLTIRRVPTAVTRTGALAGLTIKSISNADDAHACAIASDDNAYCWGEDTFGQVGDGTSATNNRLLVPTAVVRTGALAGLTIKSISAGHFFTCAIASDNNAYCWGFGASGETGDNLGGTVRLFPTAVVRTGALAGLTIKSISTGGNFTCAIASDNNAYCWGGNDYGQIGDNTSGTDRLVPTAVSRTGALAGLTIKSISAGGSHTCAIASDNNAYCWGRSDYGQIGDNTSDTNRLVPTAVTRTGALAGLTIKSISAEGQSTCVVASDNNAYCWGGNYYGQIGDNTSGTNRLVPTAVTRTGALAGLTIKSISTGNSHTCAIASNNNAYCWGANYYGELGNNSPTSRSTPTPLDLSITTNTVANTTTWTWSSAVCFAPGLQTFQYRYTISPSGYDSGWVNNSTNLSVAFTTATAGQTYKVEIQYNCPGSNGWVSGGSVSRIAPTAMTALLPTGYLTYSGTVPTITTVGNIDNTVAAYDTTYLTAGVNSVGTISYSLSNMPSNFSSINSLTYNIRYKITPLSNDTETLSVRIYKSNGTTPLTDEMLVRSTTVAIVETNTGNITFTGVDKAATKADWDGAVIEIKTTHNATGGKDNSIWSINEIEIGGIYQ